MEKINPLLYITDTDPVPEVVLDASGWFETEYLEIKANEKGAEYLEWYMAQGWVLYETTSLELGTPTWSWSHGSWPPGQGFPTPPSFAEQGYEWYTSPAWTDINSPFGSPFSMTGRYIPSATTAVYRMRRRKLQAERCLQSMITEFTNAYNEGRSINDSRYDELVQLYNVMLDKSETEMAATDAVASGYNTVIDSIIAKLGTDFTTHEGVVTGLLDDYGDSLREEINTRFDNELSKAEQALVDRGMYNTTVWTSVSAGIETQRSKALTDLEDKIADKTLANQDRLHALRINMRNGMMDAHFKLLEKKQANAYKPLEFRNAIFKFMLDFMERRTDDYPGIDGLANIAAQLGFSEGAATVAPTAT